MLEGMKTAIRDSGDDEEITAYLKKLIAGEAGDRSGLIYGMGHAVYTKSDPRARILKANAEGMAIRSGFEEEFRLLASVERLAPALLGAKKGGIDAVCANVDLYSGWFIRCWAFLTSCSRRCSRLHGWQAGAHTASKR